MPTRHVVKAGESVISLSEHYGLFSETIWAAPENAELKARRPDMNTLLPGDVLVIPDKREGSQDAGTGKKHRFRRKGIPAHFQLQLYDFGEPRANQDYTLVVDDVHTIEGTTDEQGVLNTPLPAGARAGLLTIGEDAYEVELAFGELDPGDEISGSQQRLCNLGYDCGAADGKLGERTQAALRSFQKAQGLELSGQLDTATRDRLAELHDATAETTLGASSDTTQG